MMSTHKTGYFLSLAVALALLVPSVQGQIFNLGTFIVDDDPNNGDVALSIPAGTYNSYSFRTDWSAISGDPWSNEAIWAITDGPLAGSPTFFADPGPAPNSAPNGDPVTLQWNGFLDVDINGPLNGFLLTLQSFTGSSAQWANTVLELSFQPIVPPTLDIDLGVIQSEFIPLIFDTFGSNFDTELGLYSMAGELVAVNDDIAGTLQSLIAVPGGLPAGDYIMVLGGFNTVYEDRFQITPGDASGDFVFRFDAIQRAAGTLAPQDTYNIGFTIIPEPAGISLLVGLALLALRRRNG